MSLTEDFDPAEHQARSCEGKIRYTDFAEAKAASKLAHKRFKSKFNSYQCRWCPYWHIGTNRRKLIDKIKEQHEDSNPLLDI